MSLGTIRFEGSVKIAWRASIGPNWLCPRLFRWQRRQRSLLAIGTVLAATVFARVLVVAAILGTASRPRAPAVNECLIQVLVARPSAAESRDRGVRSRSLLRRRVGHIQCEMRCVSRERRSAAWRRRTWCELIVARIWPDRDAERHADARRVRPNATEPASRALVEIACLLWHHGAVHKRPVLPSSPPLTRGSSQMCSEAPTQRAAAARSWPA